MIDGDEVVGTVIVAGLILLVIWSVTYTLWAVSTVLVSGFLKQVVVLIGLTLIGLFVGGLRLPPHPLEEGEK